jgi:glyoxylase-like metal-dependent hydrolase (beta-lactamase superfamily II)
MRNNETAGTPRLALLTEPEPQRGVALTALPGIARIVAPNTGPMTYHGTNTYLIEGPDGTIVVDPGPADAAHVDAVLAATGGRIGAILLSHSHRDHVGALPALRAACEAPVFAWHRGGEPSVADVALVDGDTASGWTALHTPGHAADHLCFARDGVLLSADLVMGWSTTVVSPPDGAMGAYFRSLRRLLARNDHVYLPGHGPPIHDPRRFVQGLLGHREQREAAIAARLRGAASDIASLVEQLYAPIDPRLRPAAARNVLAHLLKLRDEGRVVQDGEVWRSA